MNKKSKESMFNLEIGVEGIDASKELEDLEKEIEDDNKKEGVFEGSVDDSLTKIEKAMNILSNVEGGAEQVDISNEMKALEEEVKEERS